MCTFKIDGFILRTTLESDYSARIAFITRPIGRLNLIARRLKYPGNPVGPLMTFSLDRLLVRRIPDSAALRIEELEVIEAFPRLSEEYQRFVCGSYIAELLIRAIPERSPCPELYDLIGPALRCLSECRDPRSIAFAVELNILSALGYSPSFTRCVGCNAPLAEKGDYQFSIGAGGILCPECLKNERTGIAEADCFSLSAGAAAFARMSLCKRAEQLKGASVSKGLGRELFRLLRSYKAYHLQIESNSAELLGALVSRA
ncbi:MAG: DNA repair protein RecO [Candidatus Coatesbacteria bacterium]|nr:DNA repair protein RecO [Candidatus Coatesbacteria bacterium]